MYGRHSNPRPRWLIISGGLLLAFAGWYVWRGAMTFLNTQGDILAPVTSTASYFMTDQGTSPLGTLNIFATVIMKPTRVCQDFKVKVVRARIRECPKDTCNTIDLPAQGATICVYGPVPNATDWYEINVNPDDPIPMPGYMHQSVLAPPKPTARPTATLKLPTVTPGLTPTSQR